MLLLFDRVDSSEFLKPQIVYDSDNANVTNNVLFSGVWRAWACGHVGSRALDNCISAYVWGIGGTLSSSQLHNLKILTVAK